MLWSLNLVLKATVRGARDSRVSLLIGLCWHQARPTSTKTVSGIAATARQRRQRRNNIFIRPGWAPPGAHGSLLWRVGCQGLSTGCPRLGRASCRLKGRQVWLVRDARSDSYARVHGLATVSARPVFVVRARLSKIERGPCGACSCLDRGCSRACGQLVLPPLQPTGCIDGQSAFASAQQKPLSSRATATATIVRRFPR